MTTRRSLAAFAGFAAVVTLVAVVGQVALNAVWTPLFFATALNAAIWQAN